MFDRLDQIPWAQLQQTHGHAGHVPSAVRGLMSADPIDRNKAYWKLDNHIVLQGDLYEAAAYLPEFLIAALDASAPAARGGILKLMFQIGNGYAPSDVKLRYSITEGGELRHIPGSAPTLRTVCHVGVGDTAECDKEINAAITVPPSEDIA